MRPVVLSKTGPDGEAWLVLCQLALAVGPDPATGTDRWTLIGGRRRAAGDRAVDAAAAYRLLAARS